jgi:tRNA 2-thiouridine synthesizing protein D
METKKRIGFLVTAGPYTFQNLTTMYHLAKAALDQGCEVSAFLYMDAVIALNNNIRSPGEHHIPTMLKELADCGAQIVACGECAKFRGVRRENLPEKTQLSGIGSLAEMVETCDRFITLGLPV